MHHYRGTPRQEPESEPGVRGGAWGESRERRHEWGRVEGGGRGVRIAYVQVRIFSLWAVTQSSHTQHIIVGCNYYYAYDPQLSQGLTVDEKSAHL